MRLGDDPVVAVLCSDIHLSDKPPVFRSLEPSWEDAQRRPLDEVRNLAHNYQVSTVIAGDLFHRWNPTPKLINFAIKYLPRCYAVPGQHDLPNHSYEDIKHTAYWTLVETGKIIDLKPKTPEPAENFMLHGFPWGFPPEPVSNRPLLDGFHLAVIHQYCWESPETGYPGAAPESRLGALRTHLEGFRAAVVGDNHVGFYGPPNAYSDVGVFNAGGFMRRNSDQRDYKPRVGLLTKTGNIKIHYLDCSQDKCLDVQQEKTIRAVENEPNFSEFLKELSGLQGGSLDFKDTVYRAAKAAKVSEGVLYALKKIMKEKE